MIYDPDLLLGNTIKIINCLPINIENNIILILSIEWNENNLK